MRTTWRLRSPAACSGAGQLAFLESAACCHAMLRALALAAAALLLVPVAGCKNRTKPVTQTPNYAAELPEGQPALREVDTATLPPFRLTPAERSALQQGIVYSQAFLSKPSSVVRFPKELPITRDLVQASLSDLAKLLATASDDELDRAIRTRYRAFMSVGWDGKGGVLLSGYYTPILAASWNREGPYQYPVYSKPAQLVGGSVEKQASWKRLDGTLMPCPSYAELEASGQLKGRELAWLTDPFDAYNVRVQGSAKIRLPDGKVADIGYAGTTGHEYVSIGKMMVADGKIAPDKLSAQSMRAYFAAHPEELAIYAAKNPRGIFFAVTSGGPFGSLGQPVTTDVTVATNKQIFPPAAAMLVQTTVVGANGKVEPYTALRLDQDTGGAMRAPGRADLYMGVGEAAGLRSGGQWYEGRMWYLVLK